MYYSYQSAPFTRTDLVYCHIDGVTVSAADSQPSEK
jgi:hypothetical protein